MRPSARPPIIIARSEAERLTALAEEMEHASPQGANLLLDEIERARIVADARVPEDVVRLHSIVRFVDEAHGQERTVELVLPHEADIEAVRAAYVKAWLADDTLGVLATLDTGAVLLPPGRLPLQGEREIRAFWWPDDGSRTAITAFDWTLDEMVGTGELAFTRGVSTVEWRYVKDTVRAEQTTRSTNLTILVRGADGRWRILRQMWGPPLSG